MCTQNFHVECARRANYHTELKELNPDEKTKDDFKEIQQYTLDIFCLRHTPFDLAIKLKQQN